MRALPLVLAVSSTCLLGGCIARTAVDIVTAPVRIASGAVDLATTSQSEADEKRGRQIRQREERLGKLGRDYERQMERCGDGDDAACENAQAIRVEMDALMPGVPVEPETSD